MSKATLLLGEVVGVHVAVCTLVGEAGPPDSPGQPVLLAPKLRGQMGLGR